MIKDTYNYSKGIKKLKFTCNFLQKQVIVRHLDVHLQG